MATQGVQSQTILVVGGGIAGITAAVETAEAGYDVILLEKSPTLGGRVAALNRYFPKLCHPTCGLEINYQRIKRAGNIKVRTMSEVAAVTGERGNFAVTVTRHPRYVTDDCTACGSCGEVAESAVPKPFNYGLDTTKAAYLPHEMAFPARYVIDPSVIGTPEAEAIKAACKYGAVDLNDAEETYQINVGAIIWATGWRPYDATRLTSYHYPDSPDIVTNVEMERLAAHDGPTRGSILRPSTGQPVEKVALIQCAGSRDHNHLPYCSRICCLASLKHAAYVREQHPEAEVDIYYIDIRAHDKLEAFYRRVANDPQVRFLKSKPAAIEVADGAPVVMGEDTVTREIYARPYDLVVLATGMEPSIVDGRPDVTLTQDDYGFVVPLDGAADGQISCGVAAGPLDVSMSAQSATAAALRAIQAVTQ